MQALYALLPCQASCPDMVGGYVPMICIASNQYQC